MRKNQQIKSCRLLILLFALVVNCSDSIAEKADDIRDNLDFYKEFLLKVQSQNEVDYILIINDRYTFRSGEIVYSGHFNTAQKKIDQTHYKKITLSDEYKKIILKWLVFLEKNNLGGFDVKSDIMSSVYISPEVRLLFIKEKGYQDSWQDKPVKWTDYRGVTHIRIDKRIYLIYEK